jgi:hypothetical protein
MYRAGVYPMLIARSNERNTSDDFASDSEGLCQFHLLNCSADGSKICEFHLRVLP